MSTASFHDYRRYQDAEQLSRDARQQAQRCDCPRCQRKVRTRAKLSTDRHAAAETATPPWGGDRLDYGLALSGLYQQAERAKHVSAATRGFNNDSS
jgi:hypothetical protein